MAAFAEVPRTKSAVRVVTDTEARRDSIPLLEADTAFYEAIPAAERDLAGGVRLPRVDLEVGPWPGPDDWDGAFGSLVVSGMVIRTVHRYGRPNLEVYGPGDLIAAGEPEDGRPSWTVEHAAVLAVLDERFAIAARRWPELWQVALQRSSERAERLASHLAALQMSKVDDRVEAILWQLADRFGRVTPDGVVVPMPLTHRVLGFLTAAKRPTISVALRELAETGRVDRVADGGWLLRRPGPGQAEHWSERRTSRR